MNGGRPVHRVRRVRPARRRDDRGGVWIRTGLVLGALVYAGVVVMAAAGFTGAVPLVVVPPVLVAIIGANNLLGGGRTHGRSAGRPAGHGRAPLSSSGPNGPVAPEVHSDAPGHDAPGGDR
ncbi:MAG TPA: hypothetical protein VG032_01805 [Acidimicrobiales bacterium]|jgi:hypothetical protein|nr:hypothetical protein [Acidimicrobiales bacterium]